MPEDHITPEEPAPRRSARRDDDAPRRREDFDDDERPRRRRRDDDDEGDVTGGLIPYKNGYALASYYVGVFSLIPCLGLLLGPIALVLGFMGLGRAKKHPKAGGKAHAIVGIVLGGLVLLGHVAVALLIAIGAFK